MYVIVQPFYGGKRDQLTAELYTPQDKKISFCTVKGAWNGVMWARCAQSVSTCYDCHWCRTQPAWQDGNHSK